MLDTLDRRLPGSRPRTDVDVIAINVAAVFLADELLRLLAAAAATAAAALLWGEEARLPESFLGRVGTGASIPLGPALLTRTAMATPVPDALRLPATVHDAAGARGYAGTLAYGRHRELALELTRVLAAPASRPRGRLGGHASARRILDRVAALNRVVLRAMAEGKPGDVSPPRLGFSPGVLARLPGVTLDALAAVLPPVAVLDFGRLAAVLDGAGFVAETARPRRPAGMPAAVEAAAR